MMSKFKILLLLLIFNASGILYSQKEKNISYSLGGSLGMELLIPKQINSNQEHFTYSNLNGTGVTIFYKNELSYKKVLLDLNIGHSSAVIKQNMTFSNPVDLIIDNEYRHSINNWIIDFGVGYRFILHKAFIDFTSGINIIGSYNRWIPAKNQAGSFNSSFSTSTNIYESQNVEYNYLLKYYGFNIISPFVQLELGIPLGRGELNFGINSILNRQNFTVRNIIDNGNYVAFGDATYSALSISFQIGYLFSLTK